MIARRTSPGRNGARPGAPTRPLLALSTLLVLAGWAAPAAVHAQAGPAAQAFAGLSVVAFGDQEVDLMTGITTLPEGGQVVDSETGITLTAARLSYLEGEFIEAEGVEVSGEFGSARAERLEIDLLLATLQASGDLSFDREDLQLRAQALHYFAEPGVVRFDGPVSGVGIEFEAAALVLDAKTGELLLVSPYRYRDGPLELASDREGALMSLTPDGEDPLSLAASNRVAPELLERLGPYLP